MRSVFFLAIVTALGLAPSTVPVPTRAAPAPDLQTRAPLDDVAVLNYALTLEHLENAFYTGALARFDERAFANAGLPASARTRFAEIAAHEQTHVQLLQTVLGDKAVRPCEYFFPYSDPRSFAALSQVLEGVGVSAYIGAAAFIADKTYLRVAASILSTEARHASYVQAAVNNLVPWSGAFDIPLDMTTVYSLARVFITSCPDANSILRVRPFPTLTVVTRDPKPGSKATLKFDIPRDLRNLYMVFFSGLEKKFARIEGREVTIPAGLGGTVYGVVSKSANSTSDGDVVAGVAILQFD
ncbi:Ferritin-like domain-containing protein [Pleurotus pulmonarius]